MGLKLKNGVEVKITDFTVNNDHKTVTFRVSPKDVDGVMREGINVMDNTLSMTAPISMAGTSMKDAYMLIKKLPMFRGAKDT